MLAEEQELQMAIMFWFVVQVCLYAVFHIDQTMHYHFWQVEHALRMGKSRLFKETYVSTQACKHVHYMLHVLDSVFAEFCSR